MAVRENLVVSAAQFLQDPSVAASSVENRVAFLRTKNLTQQEIEAALSRAGQRHGPSSTGQAPPYAGHQGQLPPQPAPHGYYQEYPPQYGWQGGPQSPRRDWRDWFIVATVMGGVGYGLYTLGKRYVYPLIAPPTPERLEQDKKAIEDQFERAFTLVDQLAKDTEALKAAEKERTHRLDSALVELENAITELKSANSRREDEAHRIRSEVHTLKDSIPKAMMAQKDVADTRLREITAELVSLKTLVAQRTSAPPPASSAVAAAPPPPPPPAVTAAVTANPTSSSATPPPLPPAMPSMPSMPSIPSSVTSHDFRQMRNSISHSSIVPPRPMPTVSETSLDDSSLPMGFGGLTRSATFSTGNSKASIPSWQLAMAPKSTGPSPALNGSEAGPAAATQSSSS